MQVCNLTTPAQFFHALRRQVLRPWRKPLIVLTPKSLLRHPMATLAARRAFTDGEFQRVIPDATVKDPAPRQARAALHAARSTTTSLAARDARKRDDVAIVRLEQLYPLYEDELLEALLGRTPTARRSSGCRKSRGTWAPGPT